jgi:hypothetical protein
MMHTGMPVASLIDRSIWLFNTFAGLTWCQIQAKEHRCRKRAQKKGIEMIWHCTLHGIDQPNDGLRTLSKLLLIPTRVCYVLDADFK